MWDFNQTGLLPVTLGDSNFPVHANSFLLVQRYILEVITCTDLCILHWIGFSLLEVVVEIIEVVCVFLTVFITLILVITQEELA